MGRKKTHTEFIKELKIVNPEITVIGKYIGALTKIEVQHTCGYQWKVRPSDLLKGTYCPKCSKIKTSKKRSKTTKQFIEELKIINPEITVIGEYVNAVTKIKVEHTCGYKWNTTPNALLKGISCPKCSRVKANKKKTKTTKQFIEELKIVNPEIIVIGKYVGSLIKIEVKHTCGYKWKSRPGDLLQGIYCPKCSGKIKKTTKQFIEELKMVNPEITVIGEYINSQTKTEVQHSCGYEWKVRPNNLLKGTSCPKCSRIESGKKQKKTMKQFIEELKIVNPEITVIGKYIGALTKIEVQHTCGHQWNTSPSHLLQGSSCPKCSKIKTSKKQAKTTKQFIEELRGVNSEITVIGNYINSQTKIEVKHSCGYEWKTLSNSLLQGIYCPKCSGKIKKTTKQFIEELKMVNPEITVIGEYVNNKTKIEVKHTCGYKWKSRPGDLLKGTSCPSCNESKGEKFLSKVLKSNNIPFIPQFNLVKNPKTNYWLKSDFSILNKEEVILIIEYDGKQHFKPIEYFGGEEALKDTQYRDSIKDEYCKENNIPFIRFNYKQSEDYIIKVLLKQLKKLKVI